MRIALGIEYDGSRYSGWQRQNHVIGVQQRVEEALAKIALEPIQVTCAGRTDAGVHATQQIVHFDTQAVRPNKAWTRGLNTHLPHDVAIKWAKEVPDSFHARFSATGRRYRYVIYNDELRPGILHGGITHVYYPVDAKRMHQAAQCLVGEHDFSAFRAANCQANSPCRTLKHISVVRRGKYIVIEVAANAFLHHMVRNITGSLVMIGRGEQDIAWMQSLLAQRDRKKAAMTAAPNGLYFVDVEYPSEFELPVIEDGPLFW